jgi:hypothetical protein
MDDGGDANSLLNSDPLLHENDDDFGMGVNDDDLQV